MTRLIRRALLLIPLAAACALPESGTRYTINVDGTESFDPNGGALTYLWVVERDADGQPLEVGTSPAGPVSFDLLPTGCTADYRIWLTVTDPAGLRASTFVEGTGSRLC